MAERRTLNKSISVSEQVNDCSLLAIVSFTWGIIHADDWGIITGKPRTFRALVVPLVPADDEAVAGALDELVAQRLVVRYTVSGEPWLWFPNFDKHQQGLHKRTTAHRLPTPADADPGSLSAPELCAQWGSGKAPEPAGTSCSEDTLPGNSGKVPETAGNSLLREVKGSEPKGSEGNQDLAPADADAAPKPAASKPTVKQPTPRAETPEEPTDPKTPAPHVRMAETVWQLYGQELPCPRGVVTACGQFRERWGDEGQGYFLDELRNANGGPHVPEGAKPEKHIGDAVRDAIRRNFEWDPRAPGYKGNRSRAAPMTQQQADLWNHPQRIEE